MKCPDCGAHGRHDESLDVYYCTRCGWDEVLDEMARA